MAFSARIRSHIRTNLVGYVALFVALGLVPAWAASLQPNSVRSRHIANGQVKRADIALDAVNSARVAPDALGGADIDELALDPSVLQRRLQSGCGAGEAIVSVAQDGTPTCAAPAPAGGAGGDLTGTYPNPGVVAAIARDAEVFDLVLGADGQGSALDADFLDGLSSGDFLASGATAGGDLTGTYPDPEIAGDAVGAAEVVDDALRGDDIDETTLDLSSFFAGAEDHEAVNCFFGTTFTTCLETPIALPRASRLLVLATGRIGFEGGVGIDTYLATCQATVDGVSIGSKATADLDGNPQSFTILQLTDAPVPAGSPTIALRCRDDPMVGDGSILNQSDLVAVRVG